MTRKGLLIALVAAVVACRSRSKPIVHADPVALDANRVDAFVATASIVAPARCDYLVRCGVISRSLKAACTAVSREGPLRSIWGDGRSLLDRALSDGTVVLDAERAARCARSFESIGCSDEVPRECWWYGGILRGTVAEGGTGTPWQCTSGAARPSSSGYFCAGKCVNSAGLTCEDSLQCQDGERCDATKHCSPRGPIGASCDADSDCARGGICSFGTPSKGRCASPPSEGELCWGECGPGLACEVPKVHGTPRRCRKRAAPGEACSFQGACVDGFVCVGDVLAFSTNGPWPVDHGICTPKPGIGEHCDEHRDLTCTQDAWCDSSRKCVQHDKAVGDPCPNKYDHCGSYAYCDPATHRCRDRLPLGSACTTPDGGAFEDPCRESFCDPAKGVCAIHCE